MSGSPRRPASRRYAAQATNAPDLGAVFLGSFDQVDVLFASRHICRPTHVNVNSISWLHQSACHEKGYEAVVWHDARKRRKRAQHGSIHENAACALCAKAARSSAAHRAS